MTRQNVATQIRARQGEQRVWFLLQAQMSSSTIRTVWGLAVVYFTKARESRSGEVVQRQHTDAVLFAEGNDVELDGTEDHVVAQLVDCQFHTSRERFLELVHTEVANTNMLDQAFLLQLHERFKRFLQGPQRSTGVATLSGSVQV